MPGRLSALLQRAKGYSSRGQSRGRQLVLVSPNPAAELG